MKRLLLVRHAKSSWDDEGLSDVARPLSARGQRDAPRMGRRLLLRGIRPDLMISSPAVRAERTASLLATALTYPRERIEFERELYLASPTTILSVLGRQDDSLECLLVVGHNPGLTELVNQLLPDLDLSNLPTSGVVAVDCHAPHWSKLSATPRQLSFYDYPKNRAAPVTAGR